MTCLFGNVLVTGGAGFIGSQLLQKLLPISERITVIDDCSTSKRENVPVSDRLTFIEASYVDEKLLERVLPSVTHIYHVACRNLVMSADNMDDDFHVNLYGGYLLLKKAKELCPHLHRFVYTSTASVYGNADVIPTPESSYQTTIPYAASKLSMEHYCQVYHRMHQLPIVVLRLSNVYGPGQLTTNPYCGVVAKFFETADQCKPFMIYGDGTQTRDYTYVDDAIEALLTTGLHPDAVGNVFNVGTGVETSVNRLAEVISEISGRTLLGPTFYPKRAVDVVYRRCLDASFLRRTLGWEPKTGLAEGLRKTDQWRKKGNRSV
ncbi:NAD-dependent epimerase/dehydratase family protein [Paenibacillus sp. N3.4]|uniref:NAD-dependent epimerase/dehydratase family protein n=1 Tax=Paenibacillus sp. N3.4 TaxID=2603222 RepID=UPI0011CBB062|nr:NAD-dependent epimerase/dehydratase family protein [Paenibacillus sp. N3.4]TXK84644.1 NAD-dependent epimerase/dehydratase family protein [Paenibacillus sp. N3.4]